MGRWALEDGGGEGGRWSRMLRRALEQNANSKEGAGLLESMLAKHAIFCFYD